MKKIVLTTTGFLLIGVGTIGIFVPVLPTTIFFVAAAWLFHRSSPKYRVWLLNHKFFGPFVKDFVENKAMKKASKIKSLITLWVVLSISAYFMRDNVYFLVFLFCVGIGVSWFIVNLKTIKP